jgi:RNA polymerase sigma-70 factor (ECF subfamily)
MCAGTFEPILSISYRDTAAAENRQEAELIEKIRAGCQTAFRHVVEKYQDRIYRTAYGILRDAADAEDVSQEVFTKVWFGIRAFNGRSSLYSWIYRIAVNECIGRLRKKRAPLVYTGDVSAFAGRAAADERPTADRELAARDLAKQLLARLSEEDRVLLLLREVEGLPVGVVAEMAGLREATVKVKLHRTRRKLARIAVRLSKPGSTGGLT